MEGFLAIYFVTWSTEYALCYFSTLIQAQECTHFPECTECDGDVTYEEGKQLQRKASLVKNNSAAF